MGRNIVTPLDISGCQLWLDSTDSTSLTSSGGAVSQWSDKSGSGHHVLQGTAANQPLIIAADEDYGGSQILDFRTVGGNGKYMQSAAWSLAQPCTWFLVGEFGSENLIMMVSGLTAGGTHTYFTSSNINYWNAGANIATTGYQTNPSITTAQCDTTKSNIWINGYRQGLPSSCGTNTFNGLTLGCSYAISGFCNGKIASILAYNRILTVGERKCIESFLSTKYGLPPCQNTVRISPRTFGYSYRSDLGAAISIPNVAFGGSSEQSFSLWTKASSLDSGYNVIVELASADSTLGGSGFFYQGPFTLKHHSNAGDKSAIVSTSVRQTFINTWHHVVCTISTTNGLRVYIDGALHAKNPTVSTSTLANSTLALVGRNSGNRTMWITNFKLWNGRRLTPADVLRLYRDNADDAAMRAGILVDIPFSEGSGTTAAGAGGTAYSATVTAAGWSTDKPDITSKIATVGRIAATGRVAL
jgi:hypothetical protein